MLRAFAMRLFVSLAVFEGCARAALNDVEAMRRALLAGVEAGRFTCLHVAVVPFSPEGVTACAVVGESHLALHAWPEEGRLFVDVASCSTRDSVRAAITAIGAAFEGSRLVEHDERDLGR